MNTYISLLSTLAILYFHYHPHPVVSDCTCPEVLCKMGGVCDLNNCIYDNVAIGTDCDDGKDCTTSSVCDQNGMCVGSTDCEPSDLCHIAGECDINGHCTNPPVVDYVVPCDDGSMCTRTDLCVGGKCVGSDPYPDGTRCEDKNDCTHDDKCQSGLCVGKLVENGKKCNNKDPCTVGVCMMGTCMITPVSCPPPSSDDDDHRCLEITGQCNPKTGKCVYDPKPDNTVCGTQPCNIQCYQPDTCKGGVCKKGKKFGAGTPCDDGNACSVSDACTGGCECLGIGTC